MTEDSEIVLVEIQETEWDEEAVLDSPFDAKDFIKVLPWKTYAEEIEEYGSLREKNEQRDMGLNDAALDAIEAYDAEHGIPDDFATHNSWDAQQNSWVIDADSFEQAREFWEFAGFPVSVAPHIDLE